ncbi:MAG: hypothetical protein IPL99_20045 [Candidatus Competibacteraceae bacterium]|nr:hypothetical protein [Candidatus Competibacteraceae bacterium]
MLISKSEFARRMKVSAAAVGKACRNGRLSVIEGKWLDEKVAVLQWDLNRQRLPPPLQNHFNRPNRSITASRLDAGKHWYVDCVDPQPVYGSPQPKLGWNWLQADPPTRVWHTT